MKNKQWLVAFLPALGFFVLMACSHHATAKTQSVANAKQNPPLTPMEINRPHKK